MIQTGLIPSAHNDLITDVSYDFYGLRLATGSLDQRIKIWQLDENSGVWNVEDDWRAHDAAISKLTWAHPEFGTILASSSFDRTVKIWEQTSFGLQPDSQASGSGSTSTPPPPGSTSNSRWVERATLTDARGTVRAAEFAPRYFGLKLATLSTDNVLRIYECLEQPSLLTWQLSEEVDVLSLPSFSSPSSHSVAFSTPTQTTATLEGASASLVAQALQQSQSTLTNSKSGIGNREADGGWCISWIKDRYWGETIAVGCGISSSVKIIQFSPSRRPTTILTLDHSPTPFTSSSEATANTPAAVNDDAPTPYAITAVSWAPSCGRSFHLIATGSRDGHVRIWRVKPSEIIDSDGDDIEPTEKWTGTMVAEFDHHKSTVGRVEWNIMGTVLSSTGNDGRVRLWKATIGNVWRPAGTIVVDQAEDLHASDVNMDESVVNE